MEETIKIIENYIDYYSKEYRFRQEIEKLIAAYKKLEEENKALKALKNSCPALSTTGVECEFKKSLEKLEKGIE